MRSSAVYVRSNAHLAAIAVGSLAISFYLIGGQVLDAQWGLIDDHEIFRWLGRNNSLPLSEIWHVIMTDTEVGNVTDRFRPAYYFLKAFETAIYGTNVHLWYLARVMGFAVFLGSVWLWARVFVGLITSGAMTIYVASLALWSGIWSRLGPSEIYGAICLGICLITTYVILRDERGWARILAAAMLVLLTVALAGLKETFMPLSFGPLFVLMISGLKRKIPGFVATLSIIVALIGVLLIAYAVILRMRLLGHDTNANAVSAVAVLEYAAIGFCIAIKQTWLIFLIPVISCAHYASSQKLSSKTSLVTLVLVWCFIVGMYSMQVAMYRGSFPFYMRYDFPAMLLVPASLCVLGCWLIHSVAQVPILMAVAKVVVTTVFISLAWSGFARAQLRSAVFANVDKTSRFHATLEQVTRVARQMPQIPIILEAYGASAYEPMFSLQTYLNASGVRNTISLRVNSIGSEHSDLVDALNAGMKRVEAEGGSGLVPLHAIEPFLPYGCVSIGIDGPADKNCRGFDVKTE